MENNNLNQTKVIGDYDVVVIGAGNSGLTAATTCAMKNMRTLLIEQHNVPGGFASSFVRGRFEFEPALHELGNFGNKEIQGDVYKLFSELKIDVEWNSVPEAFRLISENEKGEKVDYYLPFGVEEFCNSCEKYDPGSYKKVKRFFDICLECYDAVTYVSSTRGKPDSKILKKKFPNYLTTAPYTVSEVLEKMKMPKISKFILEAYWVYLGPKPSILSFTLYAIMMTEYIKFGACIPTYRSHEISQAIANRFEQLGGVIWYNTKAEKILVENNSITGVVLDKGIIKTKHIISNASPHIVYGKLIDKNNIPSYDKNLTNWRKPGSQGFSVYLGMNKSVEELGLTDYSYFMYSVMDNEKIANNFKSIKNNNDYILVALNVANKKASEKGTSILSITTLFDDAWNDVTVENYFEIKNQIAERFITDFENKMGITLKPYIEEIEVATPMTFARYTGSINGAIYGYAATVQDSTLVRGSYLDKDVNINGLRFCGGNSFRAHGYSTTYISGNVIANKTFLDFKKENA